MGVVSIILKLGTASTKISFFKAPVNEVLAIRCGTLLSEKYARVVFSAKAFCQLLPSAHSARFYQFMLSAMLRNASQKLKIFKPIIGLVSVFVVDNFVRGELPSKMVGHYHSMLKDIVPDSIRMAPIKNHHVTPGTDSSASFIVRVHRWVFVPILGVASPTSDLPSVTPRFSAVNALLHMLTCNLFHLVGKGGNHAQ